MARFKIRDSVKTYFDGSRISAAVDALLEELDGKKQHEMSWAEAHNYNQALLMAAQVRADYNAMLFDLWDHTFGSVLNPPDSRFKIDFDADYCTPSFMWDHGLAWQVMSRYGIKHTPSAATYELKVLQDDQVIRLAVMSWNPEVAEYEDFVFDPVHLGTGLRWTSAPDEDGDVIGTTAAVRLSEFLDQPEEHILEMRAAAQEIVAYLASQGKCCCEF